MLTFSKTVRTTQLDILNKPHSLADKISPPRHNSLDTTRQTQRPLPTRQTQQTSLTGRRNVPDLDTTPQTQQALSKNRSTILTYYKTVRTPPREPNRQTRPTGKASRRLDKVNRRISPNTVKSANDQLSKH